MMDDDEEPKSLNSQTAEQIAERIRRDAKKQHDIVKSLISELPERLTIVSSSVDREFLAAYKAHMVEVQAELKSLKQQVTISTQHKFRFKPSDVY